jgi:hypothetical protein
VAPAEARVVLEVGHGLAVDRGLIQAASRILRITTR